MSFFQLFQKKVKSSFSVFPLSKFFYTNPQNISRVLEQKLYTKYATQVFTNGIRTSVYFRVLVYVILSPF